MGGKELYKSPFISYLLILECDRNNDLTMKTESGDI